MGAKKSRHASLFAFHAEPAHPRLVDIANLNLLAALGIGLLIGLERERSKGKGVRRGPAGIRTFSLAAVLGAVAITLGGPGLLAAVVAGVALLAAISYVRTRDTDPGLTTEVALLLVPLLGALAMSQPLLAGASAVIIAGLLAAKPGLHRFVRGTLSAAEVGDGLVLAIATIVVWPLLPDRAMGPFNALNPHTIWLVVILVLAIGGAGHVATRLLGQRFGLPVSGLASGFVSSVATVGAMGSKAKADVSALSAAVAGGILSSVSTFVQMVLVLAAVSPTTLRAMVPMLAAGGTIIAGYGGVYMLRAARSSAVAVPANDRAFGIGAALLMAAAMAGIMLLTAAAQPWFGTAGVTMGAAFGGLVDTHAAAMSVASLVVNGKLPANAAVVPILSAMTVNAAMKVAMASSTGTPAYALRVGAGIALSMAACWAAALAVR